MCLDNLSLDEPSLRSCSLVAQSWCTRARNHLFAHIELHVAHSFNHTRRFFKLSRSPHCTFIHCVQFLLLRDFDEPFLLSSLKHPNRFQSEIIRDLERFHRIERLQMIQSLWSTCTRDKTAVPLRSHNLRYFNFSHSAVYHLQGVARSISELPNLEELVCFVQIHDSGRCGEDSGSNFGVSTLHALPRSLRRITFRTRIKGTSIAGQSMLYDWLTASPPPHLEYLWVNPFKENMRSFGNMLIAVRDSLQELYFRPIFDKADEMATNESTLHGVQGVCVCQRSLDRRLNEKSYGMA